MTSRLSSLLVRDGVVGVKRMEKAFQRQVLFGGGLDTILLEMNELTEQRLLQYLSMATGLPPVTARELDGLDAGAAAGCSRELAERFGVVPLSFDGDALRVLTRDPVDLGALEELANELGAPVQPFVAPEFRFELAFDRVYGRPSEERFTRLAAASRLASPIPPLARSPSVVVDADPARRDSKVMAAVPPPPEEIIGEPDSGPASGFGRRTLEMTAEAVRERREEIERQAAEAYRRHASPTDPDEIYASAGPARGQDGGQPAPMREPEPARGAAGSGQAQAAEPARAYAAEPAQVFAAEPARGAAGVQAYAGEPAYAAEARAYDAEPARVYDSIPGGMYDMAQPARVHDSAYAAEAPMELSDADAAPVVVIEYESSEGSALDVTQPLSRVRDDGRAVGIVSGEIDRSEPSAPPVVPAVPVAVDAAAPTAPLVGADSAATVQPFRRMVISDAGPLTVAAARTQLAQADQRDRVFETLLRAIRSRTWYVALLTVQGGAAIGRVAIAGDEVDQVDVTQVLIPLDTPSAFRQAVSSASPYIGPVSTGDGEIDAMIRRMGGVVPPSALLLPLVLKNRVVALLVGHRGADMLRVTEVSELLPLAGDASDALGRIIRRGKQSRQMAAVAPPPDAPPETIEDAAATTRMAVVEPEILAVEVPPEIEALMAAVQDPNEDTAGRAIQEALGRAREIMPWLRGQFPGRLVVDRFNLGGRRLRAAQHGAILDLVVRLGDAAADLVIEKLRDARNDVRFYAVLCASEMRLAPMLVPLGERLFDSDRGTRELAIEALAGHPASALDGALQSARRALHGDDGPRVEAAAVALAALGDVRAIPELLDAHGRGGHSVSAVGRALVELTKQDFGPSTRKWRQWWDKNRGKNRIEWLLDGLAHKETEIRRSAVEDLRKATGEYFGYHHDLPRRERELARQRWIDWWNQTGRLRFLPYEEDERNRSTGLLPPQRT
jgi:hypothetical protein